MLHNDGYSFESIFAKFEAMQVPSWDQHAKNKPRHIAYSNQIKSIRNPQALANILRAMVSDDLFPNDFIIAQIIKILGKFNQVDVSDWFYNFAIKHELANVVTHASMIVAAGNNKRVDLAEAAYKKACDAHLADEVTHASMIVAAGNNKRVDLAEAAYKKACDANLANEVTHASMIDVLVFNNRLADASAIYRVNKLVVNSKKSEQDGFLEIDLHGQTYGTTYIALYDLLSSNKQPQTLTLIVGKGLHSKHNNQDDEMAREHAVRQAVIDISKKIVGCQLQEDKNNAGCIKFLYKPSMLNPAAKVFKPAQSELISYSLFPATSAVSNNQVPSAASSSSLSFESKGATL